MIINHKHQFMFFAEPHTASRACSKMLLKIQGSESLAHHHATSEQLGKSIPESGHLTFSVIRDPRDVIATKIAHAQYNYKTAAVVSKPVPTPPELVERYVKWGCTRKRFFYHDPDFVIRYEELEERLYSLLTLLKVKQIPPLEQSGVTREKKPWWEYFDRSQMNRMRRDIPEIQQFLELR